MRVNFSGLIRGLTHCPDDTVRVLESKVLINQNRFVTKNQAILSGFELAPRL